MGCEFLTWGGADLLFLAVVNADPSLPSFLFQPIILVLLDIPPMLPVLDGVVMELQDCALPLLRGELCFSVLPGLVVRTYE